MHAWEVALKSIFDYFYYSSIQATAFLGRDNEEIRYSTSISNESLLLVWLVVNVT